MATEKPLYQRTWFIVVVTIAALSIFASAVSGERADNEPQSSIEQETSTPTPTESKSESANASPEPSTDPDSEDNVTYFIMSSNGQFRDLDKDVSDAIGRAENDQTLRLLGNVLEFAFNYGQLNSLEAPTAISEQWTDGLAALDYAIELSSDGATDFVAGDITTGDMINLLYGVQSQVDNLRSLVAILE